MQIEIGGGLEEGTEDPADIALGVVAREPQRNQRIIVGPHRAVMIGHWIIARLGV